MPADPVPDLTEPLGLSAACHILIIVSDPQLIEYGFR